MAHTIQIMGKTLMALAPLALVALSSCDKFRGWQSEKPPVHLVLDMDFQPKVRAQSALKFEGWDDHRGARLPVADVFGNTLVVARGSLKDKALANRDANGQYVAKNPLSLEHKFRVRGREMSMIDHGRERYEINCAICHGLTGQGGNGKARHGLVGGFWEPAPPNFHFNSADGADNRVPMMPDGEYFETISTGKGTTMPGYGERLTVEDRWAIVHYVRALQSLSK
jgi:mono/diheme cytochrome c family protein